MAFAGSFPGFLTGMKPAPIRSATAEPRMKPRLSMPTTTSMLAVVVRRGERVDGRLQALRVFQQRGDVVKVDARLREVGDAANHLLEVDGQHDSFGTTNERVVVAIE